MGEWNLLVVLRLVKRLGVVCVALWKKSKFTLRVCFLFSRLQGNCWEFKVYFQKLYEIWLMWVKIFTYADKNFENVRPFFDNSFFFRVLEKKYIVSVRPFDPLKYFSYAYCIVYYYKHFSIVSINYALFFLLALNTSTYFYRYITIWIVR